MHDQEPFKALPIVLWLYAWYAKLMASIGVTSRKLYSHTEVCNVFSNDQLIFCALRWLIADCEVANIVHETGTHNTQFLCTTLIMPNRPPHGTRSL